MDSSDFVVTGFTINPPAPLPNSTFNVDVTVKNQGTVAPGAIIRYDHTKKKNRTKYVLAQCWVTL